MRVVKHVLMFGILTRFHALYFGASCAKIHRNSIFDVALFCYTFHVYWKR